MMIDTRRVDWKSDFEPNTGKLPQLLKRVILGPILREFFINEKGIFRMAIIAFAKRLPEVTKANTNSEITHTLIDIFDKFFEHEDNPGRVDMFRGAFKIFLAVIEHDSYYRDRFYWLVEMFVKAILSGNWPGRDSDRPVSCWSETKPFGGTRSITYILQNKQLLQNLLGDKWKYEEV